MTTPPFNQYLGVKVERFDPDKSIATLRLAAHHLNRRGVAHGGVVSSLLDSALGAAVIASIPKEWWCATISLSVQFLEGVGEGTLTGTGRVVRRGRRVAFAQGEIRDQKDRIIAVAQGSWHLWPFRPGIQGGESSPHVIVAATGESIKVGKIIGIGRNYAHHILEMGGGAGDALVLFTKPAGAILHDGGTIRIPPEAGAVHHEVEMVAVIGKRCAAVSREEGIEHVLGFAVGLDMTLRDLQKQARERGEPWAAAKGFDTSAPVSTVTLRDQVGDGSGLRITLDKNGKRCQEGTTSEMLRGVGELVAFASRQMTLERGDLLFTGTPAGVGPIAPGDVLEARLEKVGSLRVEVAAAESGHRRR